MSRFKPGPRATFPFHSTPSDDLTTLSTVMYNISRKLNDAKAVMVNLDKERQKSRELQRKIKETNQDPCWVFNGTCFIETSQKNTLQIMADDEETIADFRNQVEKVIKADTNTFLKVTNQRNLAQRGFDLEPLVKNGKINE